jgi:geranylgeranyl pyrophosphate synthase
MEISQNFNQIREEYLLVLENALTQFLKQSSILAHPPTDHEAVSPTHPSAEKSLCKEMAQYHLATGGKRIRGLIPIYILSKMRQDPLRGLYLGAAIEMLHNATLVHDDFQDEDEYRRNQPTVWKKYSGVQAINCGDAMFQYTFALLAKIPADSSKIVKLIQKFVEATLSVIEGQAQEFAMKTEPFPGLSRYLQVVRGKTSGLFSLPFVATSEFVELPENVIRIIEDRANDLGVLFQIQDDLLDIYGKKGRDQVATDIAEGKISALVAIFNDIAEKQDKKRLFEILSRPRELTRSEEIQEAIALFKQYGVKEKAQNEIRLLARRISLEPGLQGYPEIHSILIEFADQFSLLWDTSQHS